MDKIKTIGVILIVIGIGIWLLYSLYIGLTGKISEFGFWAIIVGGGIIVGFVLIFISIIFDRYQEHKRIKEKIRKEDLEP